MILKKEENTANKWFNQGTQFSCANKRFKYSQQLSGAVCLTLTLKPCSGTGRVQGPCYRLHLQCKKKKQLFQM